MRNVLLAACAALALFAVPHRSDAATLPAAPTPAETFDVGLLHVERYGAGPPIVLIPGLGSGAWTWNGVIPPLAAAHTVYAVTIAGFAGRPAPSGEVTIPRFVGDLQQLIASRRLVKPALVGHSLGGTLAIAYAEARASDLSSVVAVDGLPVFPTMGAMTAEQRAAAAAQAAGGVRSQTRESFASYERRYMEMIGVNDAALADAVATLGAESDPASVAAWLQIDMNADLRGDLARIAIPLTEIAGYSAGEPYTQEQKAAFYRQLLTGAPNVDVVLIPNAKHFVMLDQPEQFTAALTRALARR